MIPFNPFSVINESINTCILCRLLKVVYKHFILFGICLVRHTFVCQRTLICRLYSVTCYAVKKSPIKEQLILIDMYALKLIIFDLRCPDRQSSFYHSVVCFILAFYQVRAFRNETN